MDKSNKIKSAAHKASKGSKIPQEATRVKNPVTNNDNEAPVFSFKYVCRNNCLLSEWQATEISQFIQRLKLLENLNWKDIKTHSGINYKPVDNYVYALPASVPPDSVIHEMKVDKKKRLLGFREGRVFCFIWFDKNHNAIPENKSKAKH
ncbi:MAG TPA: hypothetical protein DD791_06500 [Syntrophomonas sp.]|jgi:hypothetical protein|nr:hypothetical protein [Syntrophomonas sp.]HBQ85018.1 hypothetical protein [Syntrophomonas sp.]